MTVKATTSSTNTQQRYAAAYSTEVHNHNFGKTILVFPVSADWDGYRYHGYRWATPDEIKRLLGKVGKEGQS